MVSCPIYSIAFLQKVLSSVPDILLLFYELIWTIFYIIGPVSLVQSSAYGFLVPVLQSNGLLVIK